MQNSKRQIISNFFNRVAERSDQIATSKECLKILPLASIAIFPFDAGLALHFVAGAGAIGGFSAIAHGASKLIKPKAEVKP